MKNNEDNQIHSATLCNTGMYFSKKVYTVYNGIWGLAGEFLRIFVLKVQSVRLLEPYSRRPHDAVGPSRRVGGVNWALHNTPSQK